MVVNEWQNGIPSVFTAIGKSWRMICASNSPSIIKTITNQLDAHVIIMDNAQAKINVLR
jgi:cell division protein ZapA (FtsZ GTPase activity inhibitor)